jgi:ABC-type antimicrobial peptide transport system permease subunit
MREVQRLAYAETTVLGGVFSVFGLIALCLAATGVYGVISYGVTQRTHEIGVRMALGARRGDVLAMFIRQGLRLALLGIALGLAGTFAVTRVIRSMLFGVSATDPVSFLAGAGLLLLVAAGATCIPAWRAALRDPARVLRAE